MSVKCEVDGHCQCLEHLAISYCCRCHQLVPKKQKPSPKNHVEFKPAVEPPDPWVKTALEKLHEKGVINE